VKPKSVRAHLLFVTVKFERTTTRREKMQTQTPSAIPLDHNYAITLFLRSTNSGGERRTETRCGPPSDANGEQRFDNVCELPRKPLARCQDHAFRCPSAEASIIVCCLTCFPAVTRRVATRDYLSLSSINLCSFIDSSMSKRYKRENKYMITVNPLIMAGAFIY